MRANTLIGSETLDSARIAVYKGRIERPAILDDDDACWLAAAKWGPPSLTECQPWPE